MSHQSPFFKGENIQLSFPTWLYFLMLFNLDAFLFFFFVIDVYVLINVLKLLFSSAILALAVKKLAFHFFD